MRRMTFDIPEEIAVKFIRDVPEAEQSKEVTKLLLHRKPRPRLTEEQWDAICEAANNDPETQEIQREMAALPDTMTEEWNDPIEFSKAG